MKIRYLGHSSFVITSEGGVKIVTDPYDPSVGFSMPRVEADLVTLSHHHYDHDYVQAVGGNPKIIDGAGCVQEDGVKISSVESFHDQAGGRLRGGNRIYKIETGGVTVCHLGDLGENFSPELVKKLLPVNVLLIPVGGTYTIDAAEAKKYADAIAPDVIIPMHYSTADCRLNISTEEGFVSLYKGKVPVERIGGELEITQSDLNGGTKIIILDRSLG